MEKILMGGEILYDAVDTGGRRTPLVAAASYRAASMTTHSPRRQRNKEGVGRQPVRNAPAAATPNGRKMGANAKQILGQVFDYRSGEYT